jgi:glycosyltransferase involved in cell wall biosynthesis
MIDQRAVARPRVLCLSYFFPPVNAIAAQRNWHFARELAGRGWDVTVVTPHPGQWRFTDGSDPAASAPPLHLIHTDHHRRALMPGHLDTRNIGLSRVVGGVMRRVADRVGVDRGAGWVRPAERACRSLDDDPPDIVLASGQPFAALGLARRLGRRFGRPYVLSYHDPWYGNPHVADRPLDRRAREREARTLAGCAAVITVSELLGQTIGREFGVSEKVTAIRSGYDPDELSSIRPTRFADTAIVYAGTFYPPKRSIAPVIDALTVLSRIAPDLDGRWSFHYYGPNSQHVQHEATRFGLADRVVVHGRVAREDALSAVRGAGIAVVITSVADGSDPADAGVMTAKLFETLGLGTPTLLVTPRDSEASRVALPTGLATCVAGDDVPGIAAHLERLIRSGERPAGTHLRELTWTRAGEELDGLLRPLAAWRG